MQVGEAWLFDNLKSHSTVNEGASDRMTAHQFPCGARHETRPKPAETSSLCLYAGVFAKTWIGAGQQHADPAAQPLIPPHIIHLSGKVRVWCGDERLGDCHGALRDRRSATRAVMHSS